MENADFRVSNIFLSIVAWISVPVSIYFPILLDKYINWPLYGYTNWPWIFAAIALWALMLILAIGLCIIATVRWWSSGLKLIAALNILVACALSVGIVYGIVFADKPQQNQGYTSNP